MSQHHAVVPRAFVFMGVQLFGHVQATVAEQVQAGALGLAVLDAVRDVAWWIAVRARTAASACQVWAGVGVPGPGCCRSGRSWAASWR